MCFLPQKFMLTMLKHFPTSYYARFFMVFAKMLIYFKYPHIYPYLHENTIITLFYRTKSIIASELSGMCQG